MGVWPSRTSGWLCLDSTGPISLTETIQVADILRIALQPARTFFWAGHSSHQSAFASSPEEITGAQRCTPCEKLSLWRDFWPPRKLGGGPTTPPPPFPVHLSFETWWICTVAYRRGGKKLLNDDTYADKMLIFSAFRHLLHASLSMKEATTLPGIKREWWRRSYPEARMRFSTVVRLQMW